MVAGVHCAHAEERIEFKDGAKVYIYAKGAAAGSTWAKGGYNGAVTYTLPYVTKAPSAKDVTSGVYLILQDNADQFLSVSSEGKFFGSKETATRWMLHKGSRGWSILDATDLDKDGNAPKGGSKTLANAIARVGDSLELRKNQNTPDMLWEIELVAGAAATPSVSAEDALAKLKAGNARFASNPVSSGKPTAAKRKETATSQSPFAIVLACADSRTSPELVFDQNIGDLFVIRTAGNLIDDHALGSIEYAAVHLGTRLVVVLGHERCGAVKAALDAEKPAAHGADHKGGGKPDHIGSLVRDIQPALKATAGKPGDRYDLTVAENARLIAARISKEAVLGDSATQVRVVPAVYDLDTGVVAWTGGAR